MIGKKSSGILQSIHQVKWIDILPLGLLWRGVIVPIGACIWVTAYAERVGNTDTISIFGTIVFLTVWFCVLGII